MVFNLMTFKTTSAYACPEYFFSTDLQKGDTSPDVKVIQEILNLDKRTIVAEIGPGSKGNETNFFGVGTREALKRFQALFIEYVGVANGKFNSRTRTTMNAVCKGDFFTKGGGGIYDTTSTKDTTPPIVAVAGPNTTTLAEIFRAFIGANEALQTPSLAGLIITNATAGDLRKVSSTTFSFAITPNQDANGPITIQFEADALSDLAGNKNSEATNEWKIAILDLGNPGQIPATTTLPAIPFEFPNIDIPVVGSDCSNVTSVDVSDYSNPCYGKVPTTYGSIGGDSGGGGGGGGGGGMDQIMQLLQGLMKGLGGLGGAGSETGGKTGGDAVCGCSGLPTTGYSPIGPGIGGRQTTLGVEFSGDFYTGRQGPPPPICGKRPRSGPKDKCPGIPGPHTASCCGILVDITNQPVTGSLLPVGKRSN